MPVISYWEITSYTLVTKIQNYTSQSSLSNTHTCVLCTADGCWCDIFFIRMLLLLYNVWCHDKFTGLGSKETFSPLY